MCIKYSPLGGVDYFLLKIIIFCQLPTSRRPAHKTIECLC